MVFFARKWLSMNIFRVKMRIFVRKTKYPYESCDIYRFLYEYLIICTKLEYRAPSELCAFSSLS